MAGPTGGDSASRSDATRALRPGPPTPPFPVDAAKRIGVDVTPLSGPHLLWDDHAAAFLRAKLDGLEAARSRYRATAPWADADGLTAAWTRLAAQVAVDVPGLVRRGAEAFVLPWLELRVNDDGELASGSGAAAGSSGAVRAPADLRERAHASLAMSPPRNRLGDALGLTLQEDLVVMRDADGARGAEWLAVALPSGWDPGAHGGSDLRDLHGPIPHGERLRDAGPNLARAMVRKGPFVRHVWALPTDAGLDRHPALPRASVADGALVPQLWFRSERQTTLPLPELERSVFTIRVHQTPLAEILGDPATPQGRERRSRLADALEAMSEPLARYKSVATFRRALIDELRLAAGR